MGAAGTAGALEKVLTVYAVAPDYQLLSQNLLFYKDQKQKV